MGHVVTFRPKPKAKPPAVVAPLLDGQVFEVHFLWDLAARLDAAGASALSFALVSAAESYPNDADLTCLQRHELDGMVDLGLNLLEQRRSKA
jgi:hypothetical protein